MKKKRIVALHGCNRNENFGDVLLMKIFKDWIEEEGHEVVFDRSTVYFSETLNVKILSLKEVVNRADVLVYGGGGYFGEPNNPSFKWYIKFFRDHLLPGLYFRLLGKKYLISGVGFGPISNILFRKIAMYVVNNALSVSVRDEVSKNYLLSYGGSRDVGVSPDAALSIYSSANILHSRPKFVCFHLSLDFELVTNDELFNSLLKLVSDIQSDSSEQGECCFLIDHGLKVPSDSIYHKLNSCLDKPLEIIPYKDPESTLEQLSQFQYVITTKLHVAITSYALGVTPISIAKHQKTVRFFEQTGMEEFHMGLNQLDSSTVSNIIDIIKLKKRATISLDLVNKSLINRKNIVDGIR